MDVAVDTEETPVPVAPSEADWRAMSDAARERFVVEAIEALNEERLAAPEGRPHALAREGAMDKLGRFFARMGRDIYLASDLPVHYPGARVFAPDVLAVVGVPDPGPSDTRASWIVADEGRGIDLALEITFNGDRRKDLVRNVATYARLGIAEYVVFDLRRRTVFGYALPESSRGAGGEYGPMPARAGRLLSRVLGLELAVVDGALRFFLGSAELASTADVLSELEGMVSGATSRAAEAEAAQREAEAAQREAEAAQREAEAAQREAEAAQREAEAARDASLRALRAAIATVLEARGAPVSDEWRRRLEAERDATALGRWLAAASAGRALDDPDPAGPTGR